MNLTLANDSPKVTSVALTDHDPDVLISQGFTVRDKVERHPYGTRPHLVSNQAYTSLPKARLEGYQSTAQSGKLAATKTSDRSQTNVREWTRRQPRASKPKPPATSDMEDNDVIFSGFELIIKDQVGSPANRAVIATNLDDGGDARYDVVARDIPPVNDASRSHTRSSLRQEKADAAHAGGRVNAQFPNATTTATNLSRPMLKSAGVTTLGHRRGFSFKQGDDAHPSLLANNRFAVASRQGRAVQRAGATTACSRDSSVEVQGIITSVERHHEGNGVVTGSPLSTIGVGQPIPSKRQGSSGPRRNDSVASIGTLEKFPVGSSVQSRRDASVIAATRALSNHSRESPPVHLGSQR